MSGLNIVLSILLVGVIAFAVLAVARFVLKLTTRVVGCLVTAVIVIGAAVIIALIFF